MPAPIASPIFTVAKPASASRDALAAYASVRAIVLEIADRAVDIADATAILVGKTGAMRTTIAETALVVRCADRCPIAAAVAIAVDAMEPAATRLARTADPAGAWATGAAFDQ